MWSVGHGGLIRHGGPLARFKENGVDSMPSPSPASGYQSWRQLPPFAGLATVERVVAFNWSVAESVGRWKRMHYVLKRLHETLTDRITAEPVYELKTAFSHHAWLCAEHATAIRQRVGEMREPPLGLEHVPHPALQLMMDEIRSAPTTEGLVLGVYGVALPALLESARRMRDEAHPLADAPSVRVAKWLCFELDEVAEYGQKAIACLVTDDDRAGLEPWSVLLQECLAVSGGVDGTRPVTECPSQSRQEKGSDPAGFGPSSTATLPNPIHSSRPWQFDGEPKRDARFKDSFNAGVNPEAFLYDPQFSARDKTLMMFYKRLRELDVPEMMASILHDLRDAEPWEFHREMSRQLWDEARHAMMGEAGFVSLGLDWTRIPVNFTWSRNLNLQLDARERHGVLYFIEQGLMQKTGKRHEWEVGMASGDPLAGMFQDFDWADEVLHSRIGRRWYVSRYASLREALEWGDRCWTKVVSHWHEIRAAGLTAHRNWWPELYLAACERWQAEPDPAALAFATSYESVRADLKPLRDSDSE